MKLLLSLFLLGLVAQNAQAVLVPKTVEYRQGDTVLEGYLAYDNSVQGTRPGVLVIHEWMGLGDYEKRRAKQLAALGYVAFAADIYGKGVRPATYESAAGEAGKYRGGRPDPSQGTGGGRTRYAGKPPQCGSGSSGGDRLMKQFFREIFKPV